VRTSLFRFLALIAALVAVPQALAQVPSAGQELATSATADHSDYVIGIEDQLRITVWGEPALNLSVVVRPDGKISIPLVNDFVVEGKTAEEIRSGLANALKKLLRDPNVTVIVEQINSFRVFVLGEVRNQGVLQFRRPTRLLQAIAMAGGLTDFAKKDLVLFRSDGIGAGERVLHLDYRRLITGERPVDNIFLKPGDTILVQ
jgi:polysaccharide export outer membrane protein